MYMDLKIWTQAPALSIVHGILVVVDLIVLPVNGQGVFHKSTCNNPE